ncbi:(Fe-S)-binding protein [bacterium]|nr:(Fe-S)-binding protein [bacterium]
MTLPIGNVLGILVDNLKLRKSVVPLSNRRATAWAEGLGLKEGGDTVLYTGHIYQLIPYISSMSKKMAELENSWITKFMGIGRIVNKVINLSPFLGGASKEDRDKYNKLLQNIALLLKEAKVDFGYLYSKELYSGALAFDQGADKAFAIHANKLNEMFKKNGVKTVITVDPHTTNMLRSVYPKYIKDYQLEVKSYLEVLAEKGMVSKNSLDANVVVHDSCVYARYENVVDAPRQLLVSAGATIHEPELSGKLTHCCGGAIESLFPGKAHQIAEKRAGQLNQCGENAVTMCPICMANLQNTTENQIEVKDISEYLVNAYC